VAETAAEKALRLLTEGRLMVRVVNPAERFVVARCRGDSGQVYDLGYDPRKNEWRCTCDELKGNCSHLRALKLVVEVPRD
jgi:hypothetical protein